MGRRERIKIRGTKPTARRVRAVVLRLGEGPRQPKITKRTQMSSTNAGLPPRTSLHSCSRARPSATTCAKPPHYQSLATLDPSLRSGRPLGHASQSITKRSQIPPMDAQFFFEVTRFARWKRFSSRQRSIRTLRQGVNTEKTKRSQIPSMNAQFFFEVMRFARGRRFSSRQRSMRTLRQGANSKTKRSQIVEETSALCFFCLPSGSSGSSSDDTSVYGSRAPVVGVTPRLNHHVV